MSRILYGIYGAGGCGRGIMPLARDMLNATLNDGNQLVFIDDEPTAPRQVNGHAVMSYDAFRETPADKKFAAIAIANGNTRSRIAEKFTRDAVSAWTVSAASVIKMDDVAIGEGALLSPHVIFTSNIRVGRHFHANLASYIEHDCVIGDYVTFAPSVRCNGNVVIEDFAYIGTGAILRQGTHDKPLTIGRGAVVGMGAVVTKDVAPGTTVVGNPARPLVKSNG